MKPMKSMRVLAVLLTLMTVLPLPARAAPRGSPGPVIEVGAETFGLPLSADALAEEYSKPSILLESGAVIRFQVMIPETGYYTISFDMVAAGEFINAPKGKFYVDGETLNETQEIVFPIFFQDTAADFPLDRYGNEALIRQERLARWSTFAIRDADFSQEYPIQFYLTRGEHTFEFDLTRESMLLGSIYISAFEPSPEYSQYLQTHPEADTSGTLVVLEAEKPTYKNNTAIRPINSRSLTVTPYDTYSLLLNTMGGENWKLSGSAVYYEFTVPQSGMYCITFRYLQNYKNNFTVFRKITLNGEVPFAEANAMAFASTPDWTSLTLGGEEPYRVYLQAGVNVLGIEATNSPYHPAIEKIKAALVDINTLALEIKKLTGNQVDPYREWEITDYIPDIRERLLVIADGLQADMEALEATTQNDGSQEILTYQMAIDNIVFLAEEPDKIPVYMNRFSEGSGSAAQLLGSLLPLLQDQPLALDKIYVHSPDATPEDADIPFYTSFVESTKRFFNSFAPNPYQTIGADEDEIEVWVNRPRQYVDLMQLMADQSFTQATGIKVKFSIMPDEGKLVLANAAGIQPDVALGVSTNIPYELAVRNALYDLRSFDDFDSYIGIYSPGALLSYIINDSVYAIPETQDFWVTFYRKDILDSLGIPVPHTWNEVIEILPELQRNGMNFNTPLSSGTGMKQYLFTAPYFFNYGAQLYSEDGYATGLDSEEAITAMKFMAESFTVYGMPLTTSSFYDRFRYGSLPIGVSNFVTYVQLTTAAPELNGLWGIDLYPATVLPDGTQNRYATGSAQACIMFANTDRSADSWEFMKWWMSTETQVEFQQQLILNYGPDYLWNSANLDAFQYSPIPDEHKAVILEQWEWLQEPIKLPGSYMQERQISNAWNAIVFDGVNPRVAIDDAIIIINREIARKMEEFGYLENGVRVKEYKIPTIETVKEWMENAH